MTTSDAVSADGQVVVFIVTPSADALAADRLVRAIEEELREKGVRGKVELSQARATEPKDLTREVLSRLQQTQGIVHLYTRSNGQQLVFTSDPLTEVNADIVARALKATGTRVATVALSDCFTDAVATSFMATGPGVVGTTSAAGEAISTAFFRGFYRGLVHTADVDPFDLGRVQVELEGHDAVHCHARAGLSEAPPAATSGSRPTPAAPARALNNLRHRNPSFTGRTALLDQVAHHLAPGRPTIVQAFEGMGGVGKSELAVEFAYRHLEQFEVVWWVGCEELEAIPGVFDELAVRLGLPGANAGERLPILNEWFYANDGWLVIADNVTVWNNTAPLLPISGRGSIIVTTRERGVHAGGINVDVFTHDEARDFVRRRLHQPDVNPEQIVEALDRLPLALEQACSYMLTTGCSVEDYAGRFRTRAAELLDQGATGGHEHTVAATFSLSLQHAKHLAADDPYAVDPEELATLFAFLAADRIPLSLLGSLDDFP